MKVVPTPATDFRSTVPPICSMLARTTSMPTPRPEMLVTLCGGGEAGREDQIADLRLGFRRNLRLAGEALLDGLGAYARNVEAAAVIGDLDDDMAALVPGGEPDRALRRLACGDAARRRSRCRDRRNCAPDA